MFKLENKNIRSTGYAKKRVSFAITRRYLGHPRDYAETMFGRDDIKAPSNPIKFESVQALPSSIKTSLDAVALLQAIFFSAVSLVASAFVATVRELTAEPDYEPVVLIPALRYLILIAMVLSVSVVVGVAAINVHF